MDYVIEDMLKDIGERTDNFRIDFFVRTLEGEQCVATFDFWAIPWGEAEPTCLRGSVQAPNLVELLRKVAFLLDEYEHEEIEEE